MQPDQGPIQLPIPLLKTEDGEALGYIKQTKQPGNDLGDDGSRCRADHSHVEGDDEQQVQPYIEQGGQDQEIQRGAAVAQCA